MKWSSQRNAAMMQALQNLPEEQRRVIVLAYFGGYSQSAIMVGMDCDTIRELLEEYALGLLDVEEQRQVEQHLAGCPACQAALDEYRAVLATLPEALASVSPYRLPPSLKPDLMARITPGTGAETPHALSSELSSGESAGMPKTAATRQTRASSMGWLAGLLQPRFALLLTLVLLVATLAWGFQLNVALARERSLRAEYVELVGQQQELVLEVLDSPETVRRVLRAAVDGSNAYGKVFTRPELPFVVAMAARLPQPPAGQAYQLWLVADGELVPAGTMAINGQGFGLLVYTADNATHDYQAALLTLQSPGATTPSDQPVLAWYSTE
jgi:hypothetical protein